MSNAKVNGMNENVIRRKAASGLLGVLAIFATHLCIAIVGSSIPQVAFASGGQCKWEGGPGTAAACKDEDCMEDGGNAMCEEPIAKPPTGIPESWTDGEGFAYGGCDMA